MYYLTINGKIKNKPTNGKESYFIIYERPLQDQNLIDTSVKLIPCPVNCEAPPVKEKSPSKNWFSKKTDSYLKKEHSNPYENISGEHEVTTVISPANSIESNSLQKKYKV